MPTLDHQTITWCLLSHSDCQKLTAPTGSLLKQMLQWLL